MIRHLRRGHDDRDAGVTLVEQLVAMVIFLIVAAIVTSAVISMFKTQQRVSAQNDNLNTARKIQQTLDLEARYADAVTTPGTGTDGSTYVEWQQVNSSAEAPKCYQWRYVPSSGLVQQRSWYESYNSSGVTGLKSWNTLASGVTTTDSTPIFQLGPYNTVDSQVSTTGQVQGHQQLTMTFTATHAGRSLDQAITITAINSVIAPAVASSTCAEEGRS